MKYIDIPKLELDLEKIAGEKLPQRHLLDLFSKETELTEKQLTSISVALQVAGRNELRNYSPLDALGKIRKGIGTIVIDCSQITPQENFNQLAEETRAKPDGIAGPDFYATRAYTMGVTLEALRQMLEYTKSKPRFRPEDKEVTAHLELIKGKIASNLRVNSDISDDTPSLLPQKLELLAESLKMQKFILVLSNTQDIPEHSRETLGFLLNRRGSEPGKTSVMFLSKPKNI